MTTWNAAPMPELGLELVRDVDRERFRSRLPRWDPRLWGDAQFSKNTRPGNRLLKLGLAWGRERVKARKLQQENVTPTGDVAPVSRFTGKEEDVEVGLQYFGKRYLSPYLGRWISADPLAVHVPGEADLNLYAYVSGQVLRGTDPNGLECGVDESCAEAPAEAAGAEPPSKAERGGGVCGASLGCPSDAPAAVPGAAAPPGVEPFTGARQPPRPAMTFREIQMAVDAAGAAPTPLAPVADVASVGMSIYEGEYGDAAIGAIAIIPGLDVLKAGKYAGELEDVATGSIRLTQPTVSPNFSDGGTITNLVDQLNKGKAVSSVPAIRVVEHEGALWTLDNRRLVAFSQAGAESIPVSKVSLSDPAVAREFWKKFNPIRGEGQHAVVAPRAEHAEIQEALRAQGLIQ